MVLSPLAQVNLSDPKVNPVAKFGQLSEILNRVIPLLTIGAAILFLIAFIYGGFTVLTAGGDAKNVQKAQSIMKYAILGLVIVVLSYLLVHLINFVLKTNIPI